MERDLFSEQGLDGTVAEKGRDHGLTPRLVVQVVKSGHASREPSLSVGVLDHAPAPPDAVGHGLGREVSPTRGPVRVDVAPEAPAVPGDVREVGPVGALPSGPPGSRTLHPSLGLPSPRFSRTTPRGPFPVLVFPDPESIPTDTVVLLGLECLTG